MKIFLLPDLGEGLAEAEIHEWHVKVGDEIKTDQLMVSVETAKAVVDVPAPRSGKIVKLYGNPGDIIQVGAPLVEFADGDETTPVAEKPEDSGTVAGNIVVGNTILEESPTGIATGKSAANIKATPAVRNLAKQLNVDLTQLTGTGSNQQITADDVHRATQKMSATTQLPTFTGDPIKGVRRSMAQTMSRAHSEVAPVTLVDDADIYAWSPDTDITLRIIRAIIAACEKEPALNAWYDGLHLSRKLHTQINLGIAVDTTDGLFVPVIKNVGNLSPSEIRETINQYKEQLKDQSLATEAFHDATITLSNFGTFAGRYANPIVVPPTVAIIGAGRIRDEVVALKGEIAVHRILPLSVTIDHRATTGGEASRFLAALIADLQTSH